MNPRIRNILVPLDFSEHSDRALQYALTLARSLGAQLHLLHVAEDLAAHGPWSGEMGLSALPVLQADMVAEAERRMRESLVTVETGGQAVTTSVVTGHTLTTILETALRSQTDLIVMGTHGRTGLAHLVLGSIAEQVVRLAPCAVLTVREPTRAKAGRAEKAVASTEGAI